MFIPKNLLNELVNSDGTRISGDNVKLNRDDSKSASDSTMDPMYDPEDGDQLKNSVVQSTRQPGYRGYYSLVPMPAVRTPTASVYTYMNNIDYMGDESGGVVDLLNGVDSKKYSTLTKSWGDVHIIPTSDRFWDEIKNALEKSGIKYTYERYDVGTEYFKIKNSDKMAGGKKLEKISKNKMKEMVEDIVSKKISKDVIGDIKKYGDINKNGVPDIDTISDENPLLIRKVKNLIDIIQKNQATGEQKGVILNFLINNINTVDIPNEYKNEMLKKLR